MPNHVTHKLMVEGKNKDLQKFLNTCFTKEGELDFNSLVPMPKILKKTICGNTNEMQTDRYKSIEKEAIEKTGFKNWYDWSLDKWGTKWNAYHTQTTDNTDSIELMFDTAWSCPVPIFEVLEIKWPVLTFEGFAIDEGFMFGAAINVDVNGANVEFFNVHSGFYEAFGYRL